MINSNMKESFNTTIRKTEEKTLLTTQLKRTSKGVKLYLKSQIIEDFFSSNPIHENTFPKLDGSYINTYNMPDMVYDDLVSSMVRTDMGLKNRNQYSNLSFLRAVGLSKGVSFDIDGVYSRTALEDYMSNLKTLVRKFYEYELKPYSSEVEFKILESV